MFEDVHEVFVMFTSIRERTYVVVDLAGWSPDSNPLRKREGQMIEFEPTSKLTELPDSKAV
jgi:hypothetical protein